jgi:UDP-3-O-[3-hydroxymyristoyl] glucosamine N-acyltransferase
MTVNDLAARVNGRVEGDGSVRISGVAALKDAEPGDISFLANPRYAAGVAETRASAVVVAADWTGKSSATIVRVGNPDAAFAEIVEQLAPPPVAPAPGIHPTAVIAADAVLGAGVSVGPHAVLEPGVRVGDRTAIGAGCCLGRATSIGRDGRLYPLVSTREGVAIGDRVIIHNGAVIGSDGFGYVREKTGWKKIRQTGTVAIGDDVEIGANVTIDRARFGKTVIGNGVKIDNLVQIAHNVEIGEGTAIAAQTGISGSSTVGRNAMLGGQTGIAGHLTIGDGAICGAQSGVTKDIPPGTFVSGYPAMPHDKAKRMHAHVMRLPELKETVKDLEKRVRALEGK